MLTQTCTTHSEGRISSKTQHADTEAEVTDLMTRLLDRLRRLLIFIFSCRRLVVHAFNGRAPPHELMHSVTVCVLIAALSQYLLRPIGNTIHAIARADRYMKITSQTTSA